MNRWLGIDIGGTAVKAGVVAADGSLIYKASRPTHAERGREFVLSTVLELARELLNAVPSLSGIGVGSAGRIDPNSGTILYATENLPGWSGTPLRAVLHKEFGLPVCVDNDVNAAATGECWIGAAASYRTVAMLCLGTGVGGAYVYKGTVIGGARGGAAEWGHMILHPNGLPCNCKRRGCLEQYVSGTALNRAASRIDPSWDSRTLLQAAENAHPSALEVIESFSMNLAIGIVNAATAYDPEAVIIGGGLITTRHVWWTELQRQINLLQPGSFVLLPAVLGNDAGIIGAARQIQQMTVL